MIGIIVAMEVEKDAIVKLMELSEVEEYGHQKFNIGQIAGKDVVIVEGGIGKVASTITCTRLIEKYHCDTILNIGTAGGIKDYENILDVVVADRMTYHDWIEETINDRESCFANAEYVFEADRKLVELAEKTMEQVSGYKTYIGPIVSGDAFVSLDEQVEYIQEHFPEALACDMESTSVGHVCSMYDVPFVIIRSLSDIVTKENNGLDFMAYAEKASARAAVFTEAFIKSI